MDRVVELERREAITILRFSRPDALNAIGSISDCDDCVGALGEPEADRTASALFAAGLAPRQTSVAADDLLEPSAAFQAIVHETADHREAVEALLEKRPPIFNRN